MNRSRIHPTCSSQAKALSSVWRSRFTRNRWAGGLGQRAASHVRSGGLGNVAPDDDGECGGDHACSHADEEGDSVPVDHGTDQYQSRLPG